MQPNVRSTRSDSYTPLAIPFQFTANLTPEVCIARLQAHAHRSPPIVRIIYRNSLDFAFDSLGRDRWMFSVHSRTRRGNVHAGGEILRLESQLTLVAGHAEWNRFTYAVLVAFDIAWLLVGLVLLWLFQSWLPMLAIIVIFGLFTLWNVWYMRRQAAKLVASLEDMIQQEPTGRPSTRK